MSNLLDESKSRRRLLCFDEDSMVIRLFALFGTQLSSFFISILIIVSIIYVHVDFLEDELHSFMAADHNAVLVHPSG